MRVGIVGASGNIGSALAVYLLQKTPHLLTLFIHRTKLPQDLETHERVTVQNLDLEKEEHVRGSFEGIDCIIYCAGILFRGGAEKFLPVTNTQFVIHAVNEAVRSGVKKFILLSFPHVEGETTPQHPALGIIPPMDPEPVHARTRLHSEKHLLNASQNSGLSPLIIRAGVIYAHNAKLIRAARRMMGVGAMFVWQKPTWIHLLSMPDLLQIIKNGIENEAYNGILNAADDRPLAHHDFFRKLADHWKVPPPLEMPDSFFESSAHAMDLFSRIFRSSVPLNPDILQMAMMSSVASTARLKQDLGYQLLYPTIAQGIALC